MKPFLAAALPLLFAGCMPVEALSTPPQLTAAADPAIASPVPYAPPLLYTPRRVTEPEDWRSLNDAQAPSGGE